MIRGTVAGMRAFRSVRTPAALLAALALGGCATVSPGPPRSAATRPLPGYDRRVDALAAADSAALAGRRIVLDPGHGGIFRGALGVGGLTEAEVNLGVALFLRGLLEARGAEVRMTRTDDRDFLSPADSSLRSDLAERVRIANAFAPDLFVSIHHNADARGAHDVNETQTYYKLGDEGPSLEAAESVHRFLVRNLGIRAQRIVPGNYFVLRGSEAPALLTESSYITNPDVESRLALAAKQRLEAEALLLGIAHYFSRGAPRIARFVALGTPGSVSDTLFDEIAAPRLAARIEGAFDEARLELDGAAIPAERRGPELEWLPAPLAAGRHVAELQVRRAGAGTSRARRLAFTVRRAPARLAAASRGVAGPAGGLVAVRVAVFDRLGLALRDSLPLRLRALARGVAPADTAIVARDGAAWAYLRVTPLRKGAPRPVVRAALATPAGAPRPAAGGVTATLAVGSAAAPPPGVWTGFALAMPDGTPLAGVRGTEEPAPRVSWLNRDGFAVLRAGEGGGPGVQALAGYRPWDDDTLPPRLVAIADGALHGRRIVLDPDGGGDDAGGVGPSGTRGASLNLSAARILAGYLTAAGAEVRLTREGDFAISDVERVQISEAFGAERFLRIAHRAEPPIVGYYFSSAAGRRWADATARTLGALGLPAPAPAEDAQYPLQQTSCPALAISAARVDDPRSEVRLLQPGALRAEAYALFLALAREWAPAANWPLDSIRVRADGRPLPGAAVVLGRSLLLETGPDGWVRFAHTEPGPLRARVEDPRLPAAELLLDFPRGVEAGPADR